MSLFETHPKNSGPYISLPLLIKVYGIVSAHECVIGRLWVLTLASLDKSSPSFSSRALALLSASFAFSSAEEEVTSMHENQEMCENFLSVSVTLPKHILFYKVFLINVLGGYCIYDHEQRHPLSHVVHYINR